MKLIRAVLAMAAATAAGVVIAQITPPQAVNEARSLPRPDPKAITSGPNAASTVPQYGADASSMSNLHSGGYGDLTTPGSARVTACNSLTDSECQAVQLLQNGRLTRPSFTINPSDPLVSGADAIRRNPTPVIGPNPGGITFPSTQCTTSTTTTPGTYTDETCDIATPTEEQVCEVVRDILVDRDANYRCDTIGNKLQTFVCDKTLIVNVTRNDIPTCTADFNIAGGIPGGNTPGLGGCDFDYRPIGVACRTGDPNLNFIVRYQAGDFVIPLDPNASSVVTNLCVPYRISRVVPCDANGNGCQYRFEVMRSCFFDAGNGTWNCGSCFGSSPADCGASEIEPGHWAYVEAGLTAAPFTKPRINTTWDVTEAWNNGCAALEARQ